MRAMKKIGAEFVIGLTLFAAFGLPLAAILGAFNR